jgi:hypothetical protein
MFLAARELADEFGGFLVIPFGSEVAPFDEPIISTLVQRIPSERSPKGRIWKSTATGLLRVSASAASLVVNTPLGKLDRAPLNTQTVGMS